MKSLLRTLLEAGFELKAEGQNIRVRGPLNDDVCELIRDHKPELLAALRTAQPAAETVDDPVRRWRVAVSAVMPIGEDVERLRDASLSFLDSELAAQAVTLGWNTVQLFGVHKGHKPRERGDAFGLIPALSFSVLGLRLVAFDCEHAVLRSQGGSPLRHPRRRANHDQAVAWWRHPALQQNE